MLPKSGTYTLNLAFIGQNDDTPRDEKKSVQITFHDSSFTVNGTSYSYDIIWGDNNRDSDCKQIILGDGRRGYYLLTTPEIDISQYTYERRTYPFSWLYYPKKDTSEVTILYKGDRGFDPCFLSGTEISSEGTTRKIEDLKIGDRIDVYLNGRTGQKPIIWIGKSTCVVRPYLPVDKAGYPVRILKNAIAENIPFKDLLVTPEHCLFFNGCFVPARMLVNGRSIFYDRSSISYDFYHIETEGHSVITADGMLTESYLDTGNRHLFQKSDHAISTGQNRNLSRDDAAPLLNVSRDFVEPLFRQIAARADKTGCTIWHVTPALTDNRNLHLVTDAGTVIRQTCEKNGHIMFIIPKGVKMVRIISNASRPSDIIGPFIDDRRYFGVAVGEITLSGSCTTRMITSHLTDETLSGWNILGEKDTRWTDGDALLPLGPCLPDDIAILSIQIKAGGPYILGTQNTRKQSSGTIISNFLRQCEPARKSMAS